MLRLPRLFVLLALAAIAAPVWAQVDVQSPFLDDPDLFIDYVDTNASFWLDVYDDTRGGFYTNVSRDGEVITAWGTNKDVLTQSRDAYAMVRAFQLTGNETYLTYARGALDFLYTHGWDSAFGGWFNRLTETGGVIDINGQKTAFIQHYALLGPMAYVEATGDAVDRAWLDQGMAHLDEHFWDDRTDLFGYYDRTSRTGSGPTDKSFNATVDAITTHALQLYLLTGEDRYRDRLLDLAANMQDRLVASMPDQAIGFAEKYDADWQPLANERLTIMGHVLKTAWCLGRLHEVLGDPSYLADAELLAQHVLDRGYDHEYGGPYKDFDRITGEMQLFGIPDTTKAWWQMEQAVTAGLELYRQTADPQWLTMADETLGFFMTYFQDPVYGEVYPDRTRYGAGVPQWGDHKGDGFKAAYHSVELGYYAYLHATLFVHNAEATLHYRFDAQPEARTIRLTPLAVRDDRLRLSAVLLDGQPYADYDADTRTLTLPANVGGLFTVGFENTAPVANEPATAPLAFALEAPAPNPFADQTRLTYTLDATSPVRLSVFDLLGREIAVLAESEQAAGTHTALFDARTLSSGVYLVRLTTPAGTATQRITQLR
ncbi:MAG: T9SS type A sorting domain-containing protein [Rhodothermaceae bacterium]|nr:T9SS type A sorting domain-containing protein [Rhodothermaceae bacterium]